MDCNNQNISFLQLSKNKVINMKNQSLKSTISPVYKMISAGAFVLAVASQSAFSALTWDLRVTHKNSIAVGGGEDKAIGAAPGDILEVAMFARVTGAGAALEGMQSALGKTIATHTGGFGGNQGTPVLESLFVNTTGALPTAQDLNSDGFIDLGNSAASVSTSTAQNWFARSSLSPGFQTSGTAIPDGTEFKLFHFNYTVAPGAITGFASLQWTQQVTSTINSASYSQDAGSVINSKSLGNNGTILGAPIIISAVPEPSAFGMVLIGALGLVGFRRLGFRSA